jgi:hypothetical protein
MGACWRNFWQLFRLGVDPLQWLRPFLLFFYTIFRVTQVPERTVVAMLVRRFYSYSEQDSWLASALLALKCVEIASVCLKVRLGSVFCALF